MNKNTLYWLAGILEGEGSFCPAPPSKKNAISISVEMVDEDVVEKIAEIFKIAHCAPQKRQAHWKQSYRVILRGARAAALMRQLRPLMGSRRQAQIDKALASFAPERVRRVK